MITFRRSPIRQLLPGPLFGRLRRKLATYRDVARLRALVPDALAQLPEIEGLPSTATWTILSAQCTRSGLGVVMLGDAFGHPIAVLKVPGSASLEATLQRQGQALHALLVSKASRELSALLPRPFGSGTVAGHRFYVEQALRGISATALVRDPETRAPALTSMADAIRVLHSATGAYVTVNNQILVEWIDRPVMRLAEISAVSRTYDRELCMLQAELRSAWLDQSVRVGWIHGDYWPENVLLDPDTGRVTGIVDWDRAAGDEPPLHDLLHLLLYTRKLVRRCQLGEIVAELLARPRWEPLEERILHDSGVFGDRASVALYWLRHVSENLGRDRSYADNAPWAERNILNVLAHCANGIDS